MALYFYYICIAFLTIIESFIRVGLENIESGETPMTTRTIQTPKTQTLGKVFSLVGSPCITIHYYPQASKVVIEARHRSPMELRGDSDLITEIMEFLEQYGYQLTALNNTVPYKWYEYRIPEFILKAVDEINEEYNYPCMTLRDATLIWASHGDWRMLEKGTSIKVRFNDPFKTIEVYGNVCYDALVSLSSKLLMS